jgi:hypothetical protein
MERCKARAAADAAPAEPTPVAEGGSSSAPKEEVTSAPKEKVASAPAPTAEGVNHSFGAGPAVAEAHLDEHGKVPHFPLHPLSPPLLFTDACIAPGPRFLLSRFPPPTFTFILHPPSPPSPRRHDTTITKQNHNPSPSIPTISPITTILHHPSLPLHRPSPR